MFPLLILKGITMTAMLKPYINKKLRDSVENLLKVMKRFDDEADRIFREKEKEFAEMVLKDVPDEIIIKRLNLYHPSFRRDAIVQAAERVYYTWKYSGGL